MSSIKRAILISSFITILSCTSQFIMLHLNRDYGFVSVIYHNLDSMKHLSKEIIIGVNIIVDFIFYLAILLIGFKIVNANNSLLKYTLLSIVSIVVIVLLYVSSINSVANNDITPQIYKNLHNYHFILFYLLTALLTLFIPLSFTSNNKIIAIKERQIKLENEILTAKYMALKNKLEPHFLFNSISVLSALIDEDKMLAQKYLDHLSSIYRYILQDREEVTLREALVEIKSYIYVLKFRYKDDVSFNQKIDKEFLSYKLIPMTLHTIIENAIKHNTHSTNSPLNINIETTSNETLIIYNNIQPPITSTSGNGIGLSNLSKLYTTKWTKDIDITRSNNIFSVSIPLIKR